MDAVTRAPDYAAASPRTDTRKHGALAAGVVPLILILALGSLLVLPRLGSQSLWLDETLTVGPALDAANLGDLVARVRAVDTQPPASHFVLYLLRDGLPRTDFWLRLPSFVAVELGLIALYLTLASLWGGSVALTTVALAQLSPFLCFYAGEARNYALWFLVLTVSCALMAGWHAAAVSGRRSLWSWALALGVANAIGLWTHLFHVFVIVAQAAVLMLPVLLRRASWSSPKRATAALVLAQVLTAALFAPWVWVLARGAGTGQIGVAWTRPFSLASIAYYLFAALFDGSFGPNLRALHVSSSRELLAGHPLALTLGAAAICVTLWTYMRLVRDAIGDPARRWELLVLVVWPIATLAGPIAYAAARDFPLHPRHLILVWPLLPLVLALGLRRYARARPLLALVVLLQLVALGNLLFDPTYAKDDERGAIAHAEGASGAVAYVLGDTAPIYVRHARGRLRNFHEFDAATTDVWLVDDRTWEEQNPRYRRDLARRLRTLGFEYRGGTTRFSGVTLRHWTARS